MRFTVRALKMLKIHMLHNIQGQAPTVTVPISGSIKTPLNDLTSDTEGSRAMVYESFLNRSQNMQTLTPTYYSFFSE